MSVPTRNIHINRMPRRVARGLIRAFTVTIVVCVTGFALGYFSGRALL